MDLIIALLIAVLPACHTESDTMCAWDAAVQGNGQGVSFISITDDVFFPLSDTECREDELLVDDTTPAGYTWTYCE